ncbi:hypothetical protein ACFE04_002476 [Oxalis oulophora]
MEMSCAFQVDTQSSELDKTLTKILCKIKGAAYAIDGVKRMVYVSGPVDPETILENLKIFDKNAKIVAKHGKTSTPPFADYHKSVRGMQMHQYPMGGGYPMNPYQNIHRPLLPSISVPRYPIPPPPVTPHVPNYGYFHQYPIHQYPNVYDDAYASRPRHMF